MNICPTQNPQPGSEIQQAFSVDKSSVDRSTFSGRVTELLCPLKGAVNQVNPSKLNILEIMASCASNPNEDNSTRLVRVVSECADEKKEALLKALRSFFNKTRITAQDQTAEYVEKIEALYQTSTDSNTAIAQKHQSNERAAIATLSARTEASKEFERLLEKHVEPLVDEWFEDQTRVYMNGDRMIVTAETAQGVNTLGAFISTSRGSCGNGQNIRWRAGQYHGTTPEKISSLYAARFSEINLLTNEKQQFATQGKTGIKLYLPDDSLLCSVYLMPNESKILDIHCLKRSEHLMMATDDKLDHKVEVSFTSGHAVNMLNDCLYFQRQMDVPGLTVDKLFEHGLITVRGDEVGKKLFRDLLNIGLIKR